MIVAGLALCLFGWLLADPPGAAPDEAAHYIRAVAAGHGEWRGRPVPALPPSEHDPRALLMQRTDRDFSLPGNLAITVNGPCFARRPMTSAACGRFLSPAPRPAHDVSYVGVYPPFLYVPLGLAARTQSSPIDAMYAARAAAALISLLLLAMTWLRSPGWGGRVGALAIAGPLTYFTATSVGTNGMEVAASACFVATGLARTRGDRRTSTTAWWLVGGAILAFAKSLGPLFLIFDAAMVALWARSLRPVTPAEGDAAPTRPTPRRRSPRWLSSRWLSSRWLSSRWMSPSGRVPALVLTSATLAGLAWNVLFVPTGGSVTDIAHHLATAWHRLPHVASGMFSNFGWLDTHLGHHGWWLGAGTWGALLVLAVALGSRWQQISLIFGIAGWLALTVGFTAVELNAGFDYQARYTLAPAVAVVLIAANTCGGAGFFDRVPVGRYALIAAVTGLTSLLNLYAWWTEAHRYAVGISGPRAFWARADWTPPLGWYLPAMSVVLGTALLASAAIRSDPPPR